MTVRTLALLTAVALACAPPATRHPPPDPERPHLQWGLAVHGGAGDWSILSTSAARHSGVGAGIGRALEAGYAVLRGGGSSLDAVEAAVVILENDSNFNAGRGAAFNHDGVNELDAGLMDGATLRVGAVAGLRRVKNPIRLARAVMERTTHVFMVAEGAERFAREAGIELVDPSYFRTQEAWDELQSELRPSNPETVGAVAIDQNGRLAAATSTGGRTNKLAGRVGDVPVIGAGTYANTRCAVSATGHGEWFIRHTVARDICIGLEFRRQSISAAADSILTTLKAVEAEGGVIAIDSRGNLSMPFNTKNMPRGYVGPDGRAVVLLR